MPRGYTFATNNVSVRAAVVYNLTSSDGSGRSKSDRRRTHSGRLPPVSLKGEKWDNPAYRQSPRKRPVSRKPAIREAADRLCILIQFAV